MTRGIRQCGVIFFFFSFLWEKVRSAREETGATQDNKRGRGGRTHVVCSPLQADSRVGSELCSAIQSTLSSAQLKGLQDAAITGQAASQAGSAGFNKCDGLWKCVSLGKREIEGERARASC